MEQSPPLHIAGDSPPRETSDAPTAEYALDPLWTDEPFKTVLRLLAVQRGLGLLAAQRVVIDEPDA